MTAPNGFVVPAETPAQKRLLRALRRAQVEKRAEPTPVLPGIRPDTALFQAGFPLGVAQRVQPPQSTFAERLQQGGGLQPATKGQNVFAAALGEGQRRTDYTFRPGRFEGEGAAPPVPKPAPKPASPFAKRAAIGLQQVTGIPSSPQIVAIIDDVLLKAGEAGQAVGAAMAAPLWLGVEKVMEDVLGRDRFQGIVTQHLRESGQEGSGDFRSRMAAYRQAVDAGEIPLVSQLLTENWDAVASIPSVVNLVRQAPRLAASLLVRAPGRVLPEAGLRLGMGRPGIAGAAGRRVRPVTAKEPWQMTQEEFFLTPEGKPTAASPINVRHRKAIEAAISEGKPVPYPVLKQYPDLAARLTPLEYVRSAYPKAESAEAFPNLLDEYNNLAPAAPQARAAEVARGQAELPVAKSAAAKGPSVAAIPAGQARAPQAKPPRVRRVAPKPAEAPKQAVAPRAGQTVDELQELIDAKLDELMAQGKTFQEANTAPEVLALYEQRFALEPAEDAAFITSQMAKLTPESLQGPATRADIEKAFTALHQPTMLRPTSDALQNADSLFQLLNPRGSALRETTGVYDFWEARGIRPRHPIDQVNPVAEKELQGLTLQIGRIIRDLTRESGRPFTQTDPVRRAVPKPAAGPLAAEPAPGAILERGAGIEPPAPPSLAAGQALPPSPSPAAPVAAVPPGGMKPPGATGAVAGQETESVASLAKTGTGDIPAPTASREEFAQAADPSGGGAPPGKPPAARGRKGAGDDPDAAFERVRQQATRGERLDQTLLRRHEAAITTAENEARIVMDEASVRLRTAGLGGVRQGRWVPNQADLPIMDDLFEALHNPSKVTSGEIKVPVGMEAEYTRLRQLTDWEEAMRIDFDPEMATVQDYFYRGWLVPREGLPATPRGVPRGRLGATPSFKKPRVNATYREMRDAGFEPLSWSPYEQWRISRLQGVRYRQQMQLIEDLKKLDLAKSDASGVAVEEWRTPRVGPAFEGKIFASTDAMGEPVAMYSRRWVVPDSLAGSLENMYGITPNLGNVHVGSRTINLSKAIDATVFIPKRAKLFGSFFQQQDFLLRSYIGAWTGMVDGLLAGRPVEAVRSLAVWPKSAYDIVRANLSPRARANIRKQLNSTTPLIPGRQGIHFRGIMEAGLSTIDTTILPRDLDQTARIITEEAGLLGNQAVRRALASLESSMRRGLFEGVYPAAQMTDIRNNIAPILVRRYGGLSDEALNGMIARVTNKKYSTIPASQSVLQSRPLREILRRVFFSIGESEGLLRQATGAIRGPEAAFWRTHWIGTYLGLIALAYAIHFATTGEPLPFARWSPLAKDKYGILPLGYNRDFASPDIPVKDMKGRNILLDLTGQLDTAFRILDPPSFLSSRESVPIRALVTQLTERDYFGRRIDKVGPGGIFSRTANLINDMFSPIGPGQALGQIALQTGAFPEGLIPGSEKKLGIPGQLIQATGLNVRTQQRRARGRPTRKPVRVVP